MKCDNHILVTFLSHSFFHLRCAEIVMPSFQIPPAPGRSLKGGGEREPGVVIVRDTGFPVDGRCIPTHKIQRHKHADERGPLRGLPAPT